MPSYTFTEKMDRRSMGLKQSTRGCKRVYQLQSDVRVSEVEAAAYVNTAQTLVPSDGLNIGQPHPDDATIIVLSIDFEDEAQDGRTWEVTVEWGYAIRGSLSPDPLSRPAEVQWSQPAETVEVFYDRANTPKPVVNSASQKFDELPMRERGVLTLRYVRNETTDHFRYVIFPLMNFYDFVVNSDPFTIDGIEVAALHARLQCEAEKITEGALTYYRVTYLLTFRAGTYYSDDGWRERYLDRGHYEVVGGELVPIRDVDGEKVEDAYPLDGAGGAAATPDIAPAILPPSGDGFILYDEVEFDVLEFE